MVMAINLESQPVMINLAEVDKLGLNEITYMKVLIAIDCVSTIKQPICCFLVYNFVVWLFRRNRKMVGLLFL